jgi:hypothetical protein
VSIAAPETDTDRRYKPGQYWRLLGKHAANPKEHPAPKFYDGYPEQGRFKTKQMDGTLVPVALYPHPNFPEQWIALVGGLQANDINAVWKSCHRHYCSEEDYNFWILNRRWPDEASAAPAPTPTAVGSEVTLTIEPAPETPIRDALAAEIKRITAWFETELKKTITSEDAAKLAGEHAETIRKLRLKAEKAQTAEIGDHYKLYKEAYNKYEPDIKAAEALWDRLDKAVKAFGRAERQKAEAEEARKRAEAEEEARKAQAAAAIAAAAELAKLPKKERTEEKALEIIAQHTPPPVAETLPAENAQSRPVALTKFGSGRGLSAEPKMIAKIIDQDALYQAHREDPKIKAALLDIANRYVREKKPCPGVVAVEEGAE